MDSTPAVFLLCIIIEKNKGIEPQIYFTNAHHPTTDP
jgi:hypothetical protein